MKRDWRHLRFQGCTLSRGQYAAAVIILICLTSGQMARAADGDLDPAFGNGGKVMTDFNNSTDIANAVALQPDGKLVVAGFTYIKTIFQGRILPSRAINQTAHSTPALA